MFHKMRNFLKKCLNKLKKLKYRKEPWMAEIVKCQAEIAAFDVYPHYLRKYRNQESYTWLHIPKWMCEDSEKHKIERCLDIGCAYGTLSLFSKKVFGCQNYCIDCVDKYLNQALVQKYGFVFSRNNIELDPFPWEVTFDVIIFTEVIEHFNFSCVPTLRKIRTLLAEDGRLYLSTPDASRWGKITKYYSSLDEMPKPQKGLPIIDDHVYQFDKEELFGVLEAAGFTVDRFDYSPGVVNRHFNLALKIK